MLGMLVAWLEELAVPEYNFVCHECKIFFDKEYSMTKAPWRSKCPECNKLSNRDWQEVAVHFKGDCHTNRRLAHRASYDQFEQHRFAETLVNKTKESLDKSTTEQFYTKMVPNDNFNEHYSEYTHKKLNTKEKEESNRRAASIANTVNKLGSHHIKDGKHIERRNEPIKY